MYVIARIGSPEYQYTAVGERSGFMLVPRCRERRAGAESLLPRIVYLGAGIDNDVLPPVTMPAGDQYSTVREERRGMRFARGGH